MLRREVVKMTGSLFGLGAGTPSRFPYPDRPQPAPGVGPSSGQNVRARVVIVSGPTGTVSGVFVYAPGTTPGPGNTPIAAMTASATDPFGNDVQPGDASALGTIIAIGGIPPGGTPSYVQMVPGTPQALLEIGSGDPAETAPLEVLNQINAIAATRVISSTFRAPRVTGEAAGAFCSLVLNSPRVDLSIPPLASLIASDGTNTAVVDVTPTQIHLRSMPVLADGGTAAAPTLISTDTWHDMTPGLLNGWAVTAGQVARYRLMPDNSVWIVADLAPGTVAGGTNVWTTPANYVPAAAQPVPATLAASTAVAQATDPYFIVQAHLQVHNMVALETRVLINARYPLD